MSERKLNYAGLSNILALRSVLSYFYFLFFLEKIEMISKMICSYGNGFFGNWKMKDFSALCKNNYGQEFVLS